MFAELEIRATILSPCYNINFVNRDLDDMSMIVTGTTSQDIKFEDTAANTYSNASLCGPRIYTFSGGMPSYLTIDQSSSTLTLATNNVGDRGPH